MAYMRQEKKAKIAPHVKAILKKYKVKGSLAVRNHSTLVLNIKSSPIDFIQSFHSTRNQRPEYANQNLITSKHLSVNPYWYQDHFDGKAKEFLTEVMTALQEGNHDRSDIQSDYFDVGWYVDINIGAWNKPYVLVN